MSCDVSCDHSHMPLYCPKKIKIKTEKKRKTKKMDKKKRKSK